MIVLKEQRLGFPTTKLGPKACQRLRDFCLESSYIYTPLKNRTYNIEIRLWNSKNVWIRRYWFHGKFVHFKKLQFLSFWRIQKAQKWQSLCFLDSWKLISRKIWSTLNSITAPMAWTFPSQKLKSFVKSKIFLIRRRLLLSVSARNILEFLTNTSYVQNHYLDDFTEFFTFLRFQKPVFLTLTRWFHETFSGGVRTSFLAQIFQWLDEICT